MKQLSLAVLCTVALFKSKNATVGALGVGGAPGAGVAKVADRLSK